MDEGRSMKGWLKYSPYADLPFYEPTPTTLPMTLSQVDAVALAVTGLAKVYDVLPEEVLETQAKFLTEAEFADVLSVLEEDRVAV